MKNKILNILNTNKNTYISGEDISKELNISRVAVSKHVKKLRSEGYKILSQTNKGYCFSESNDILSSSLIGKETHPFYHTIDIIEETNSTNDDVKSKSITLDEGYVLISDMQKKGKGRNGKSFFSPKQSGIYLSIFLKPNLQINQSLKLTACASVAVYDAIKKNYNIDSKIKWVNDIYIEDKKVVGILCEASLEMNTASLEYMVVGIGINLHRTQMPDEIKETAACIEDFSDKVVNRNQFITDLLNSFYEYYININQNTFLPKYKENSYVLLKDIMVHNKDNSYHARVLDIDENAYLVIQKEDKSLDKLTSGEISIRKVK